MQSAHLDPTDTAAIALFSRNISGEIVMLNLLRFRDFADYEAFPDLKPESKVSGKVAYQMYIDHTLPLLEASGGAIEFLGTGGRYFVGPEDEVWDLVMLIRQHSLQDFLAFASDENYLAGVGHRTAALADSRLLPLVPISGHIIT